MPRLSLLAVLLFPLAVAAQPMFDADTVRAGQLDGGKMWLFEDPPFDYLAETYDFRPDASWFEHARLASLRMPGCSASFVSPHGLVATNHHCAQGSVIRVDEGGEGLLDAGFYARSLEEERSVPGMYMDQLVAIEDVTAEVLGLIDTGLDADSAASTAQARVLDALGGEDAGFVVQLVPLYDGGRYSAYTFKRHSDVRLVMAPEKALGFFGGDPDNFTYPRYALDFAFFRIYDEDGEPMEPDHYFPLSQDGVANGDEIYVIGNPGSTSRGLTVAQLETLRDIQIPAVLRFLESRIAALYAHLATNPDNPDAIRGQIFGLSNGQKAYTGRRNALNDPYIMARRAAAERDFRAASPESGALIDAMAALQDERRAYKAQAQALQYLFNRGYGASTLLRARTAYQTMIADEADFDDLRSIQDRPDIVERMYLETDLAILREYFEAIGEPLPAVLEGPSAEAVAERMLAESALASSARTAEALDGGTLTMDDPALQLAAAIANDADAFSRAIGAIGQQERTLAQDLGRARFAAFGNSVPPDATFSLRFTDGIVRGYEYNGTLAPPMTTLSGLYDRYYSFCEAAQMDPCEWDLPERWVDAADDIDQGTPLNFISTSDTIGGNSGSPAVNRDLELVGLNFDRNINGLVRDYLYLPSQGRNVMVDVRAVLEALTEVYDLDDLAEELTDGTLRE